MRAEPLVCADWDAGQSASLRCGLGALGDADKVIVTLGDAPLVSAEVVGDVRRREPPRTRAVYDGRPGHPVVLGPEEIAALTSLERRRGARARCCAEAASIEVGHLCSGRDVDTPEDLEEIRHEARAVI